jgi:hypothetical protein
MVTAKDCHALTTYFVSKYKETTGSTLTVNRNKARWGFESVLMDYPAKQAYDLIDYYMEHWQTPSMEWFFYNYDKVVVAKQECEAQEAAAVQVRKDTAERLEEWRRRWKK